MLKPEVIANLKEITPEEREILSGQSEINRNIYMRGGGNTVNSQKLLELGKLITVRKHTRFIDFPEHTHDYVELVYMLSGQTVHIVDGKKIVLKQGELLFLGQNSRHAIEKAEDIVRVRQYVEKNLNQREREIINKRYGLNGEAPVTQRKVGEEMGISRSYVSRIEKKALEKLKKAFDNTNIM